MVIDGIGPYSSASNWGQSKQQNQQESSFVGTWAYHDLLWSLRKGAGEAVDRYLGSTASGVGKNHASRLADLGFDEVPVTRTMTYGSLLKLNDDSVTWKDLSWKAYKEQVWKNTSDFRDALKHENRSHFFDGVSAKSFVQDVLWDGNIHPFQELVGDTPRVNLGSNFAYIGGLGLLGWGIWDTTRKVYQQAHQQEDGTWQSQCHTWVETAQAFAGQTIKSLTSWEAAGVGMAIGKALIPITWFPFGGILMGSLFGTGMYAILSKWLPDAKRD